ncbi:MAG: PTS glucose transporter subunit IIA [Lachnospirales bacterium]
MFGFKKNKDNSKKIVSPLKGRAVPLKEVSDPTFSEEMLGKGMAVIPTEGTLISPVDGKVELLFDTNHAINLVSDDGMQILIHVGIDTVTLKGEHFEATTATGNIVKKGDTLLNFNIDGIKAAGLDIVTPIVILNTDEYKEIKGLHIGEIDFLDDLISIN